LCILTKLVKAIPVVMFAVHTLRIFKFLYSLNTEHPKYVRCCLQFVIVFVCCIVSVYTRDVTQFAFEFDDVQTKIVFSRFEIRRIISRTHRRIRI